jgi:hypothetical protein
VQRVAWLWGVTVNMDGVIRAGSIDPAHPRNYATSGMLTSEVMRALARILRASGASYQSTTTMTAAEISQHVRHHGPAIVLYRYGTTPEWEGYRYRGQTADGADSATGKHVGYARPRGMAGRNQLSGFDEGSHYCVVLSSMWRRKRGGEDIWLHDPNHASTARPEKPAYDVITDTQFARLYQSGRDITAGGTTWAAIPAGVIAP